MSANLREYIKPLVKELKVRGIKHTLNLEGIHAKLQFVLQGHKKSLTIPKTSSDRRGWMNDLARLKRWLGPVPFASTPTKTEETIVETKPQVAHVRFGVQATGRLSATIPIEDLSRSCQVDKQLNGRTRAAIATTSEGRVILNFVNKGGVLGTLTKAGTVVFVFSRSRVPFDYGKRPVHGRSTKQLLGRFITPNSLVLDQQLPEAILQLNKPHDPILPFGKSPRAPRSAVFKEPVPAKQPAKPSAEGSSSLSIVEEGREIRQLFNDWIFKAEQLGFGVNVSTKENRVILKILMDI